MNRGSKFFVLIASAAFLATMFVYSEKQNVSRHRIGMLIGIEGVPEISGIAWRPTEGTLLAVSDRGVLAELTTDGSVLRTVDLGQDFEGVALVPGDRECLLLEERGPSLLRVSLDEMKVVDSTALPVYEGAKKNKRYEGLALLNETGSRLVLAHEYPPALVEVAIDDGVARIESATPVDAKLLNDLVLSPDGREVVLVDRREGLRLVDREGKALSGWRRVRLDRLEGATFAPGHGVFLVDDVSPSRLSFVAGPGDWSQLRSLTR